MKKFFSFFLLFIFIFTLGFAKLDIKTQKTELEIGEKIAIEITSDSQLVKIESSGGGFDNPQILFDGIQMKNNKATINFIAPYVEKTYELKFSTAKKESKLLKLNVKDKKLKGLEFLLVIDALKGAVVYNSSGSNISSPLNKNTVIKEGMGIILPKGSFLKLKGPNEITIDVSENSEIVFETLRKLGDKVDLRYKIKKGTTYNTINQKLLPGSKYLVSDSNSVVAGVRGTRFAYQAGENGSQSKIRVFDGFVSSGYGDWVKEVLNGSMYVFDPTSKKIITQVLDIDEKQFLESIFSVADISNEINDIKDFFDNVNPLPFDPNNMPK